MTRTSPPRRVPRGSGGTGDCTGDARHQPARRKVANDDGYDLGQGAGFYLNARNRRGRRITGCMIICAMNYRAGSVAI